MTSAANPQKQKTRPKRKWLKRFGWFLAGLFLLLVIFHRPILMDLIRFTAARFAAGQNLSLQYDLEGNPLSGLTFTNVRISATGRSPVDRITVEKVCATYSIPDWLWHGRQDFLKTVEIKNAFLVLKDVPDTAAQKAKPSHLGSDLHLWLFPPLNLIGKADIENFNITNHLSDADFVLQSGEVHFERGKSGSLKIALMQIPNLRVWQSVEGNLTVTEKDFTLDNVKITPDIQIDKLVSTIAPDSGKVSRLTLDAGIFGGRLSGSFESVPRANTFDANVDLAATKFGFDGLRKFLNGPVPINGEFDRIAVQISGNPGAPNSWTGTSMATITSPFGAGPVKIEQGAANFAIKNGALNIDTTLSSGNGANKMTSTANGMMPERLKGFPGMMLDGQFQFTASDLSQSINGFTHGAINANGDFHLRNREFQTDLIATGSDINSDKFDVSSINVKGGFSKSLASGFPGDIAGRITTQFKEARLDKYALDSGNITAEGKEGWIKLDATDLKRAENTAAFNGSFHAAEDFSKKTVPDFDVNFTVSAPNAAAFNAETNLNGINGQLEATGGVSHHDDSYDGKIDVTGSKLVCGDFNADSLNAGITIEKSVANLHNFILVMDAKNRVEGSGNVTLSKPFNYNGTVQANISDLTAFNPVLATAGVSDPVGGALTLDWNGSGMIDGMHHTGQVQMKLTGGRYGNFLPIAAEIAGKYSPEVVEIPTLHVHVDKTDFVARVDLHDTELQIHDILLQQEKFRLLQGELKLPVDLRTPTNPDSLIPATGRIFANLTSDEINLESLLLKPKQTSPLKGQLRVSINADGPIDSLPANILLRIRNLQVKAAPGVLPGNLELNADLNDNQLALHGTFQQPAMSPLQINGKLPFSPRQVIKNRKIDEKSPLELSLKLEKSPVTILAQLIPRIRYLEGQMGIDARATGTISKPELSGAISLDLPAIRLTDPTAPAVNGFKGNLEFTGNQLVIHRFGGEISGGPFDLTGRVLFQKLTTPTLDLRLTSQNALILRNETLTVRADSDLKIAGIFNAANVTGNIGLTKSKFFREVEILPIDLPGKPAPKPPTEAQLGFSLKPPFANWTFNVAVKTKDPLLIHGNLANGSAHIDLKLVGTGAAPALDGLVRIDNFVASLPFSRLNIEYGYAYFTPDNPFLPTLDIQGSSSLRDYNIHVYISGTPEDPVTVFTSDPPLPQEEIVALLGTGATAEELTSNSDVLAGRAAVLVFQQFYRKIFKQKPKENQSFLTRFELNPGAVDPTTGRQEVSARFKATDQIYLIGDLDEQGGMRGQIGYLLRFR